MLSGSVACVKMLFDRVHKNGNLRRATQNETSVSRSSVIVPVSVNTYTIKSIMTAHNLLTTSACCNK